MSHSKIVSLFLGLFINLLYLNVYAQENGWNKVDPATLYGEATFLKLDDEGKIAVFGNRRQFIVYDIENSKIIRNIFLSGTVMAQTNDEGLTLFLSTPSSFECNTEKIVVIPNSTSIYFSDKDSKVQITYDYKQDKFFNPGERKYSLPIRIGDYLITHSRYSHKYAKAIIDNKWSYSYPKSTYKYFKNPDEYRVSGDMKYVYFLEKGPYYKAKSAYQIYDLDSKKFIKFQKLTGPLKNIELTNSDWLCGKVSDDLYLFFNPKTSEIHEFNTSFEYYTEIIADPIHKSFVLRNDNEYEFWTLKEDKLRKVKDKTLEVSPVFSYHLGNFISFRNGKLIRFTLQDDKEEIIQDFSWKPTPEQLAEGIKINEEKEKKKQAKLIAEQEKKAALKKIEDDKIAFAKYEKEEAERIKKLREEIINETYIHPSKIEDPIPFPKNAEKHPIYEKAMIYTDVSKWKEAVEYWTEITIRYPDLADGYYYTGEALFYQTKYEEALVFFEQGHQMNPFNSRFILNYLNCMGSFQYNERASEMGIKLASFCYKDYVTARNISMDKAIANNGQNSPYSKPMITAKNAFNAHISSINLNDNLYKTLENSYGIRGAADLDGIWNNFKSVKNLLAKRGAESAVYHYLLKDFHENLNSKKDGYRIFLQNRISEEMINEYKLGESSNIYFQTELGHAQVFNYFHQTDYDKASILVDKLILDLNATGLFRFKLLELYQSKARILFEMDRNVEFSAIATELEKLNGEYKNPKFNSKTFEMLALLYKDTNFEMAEKYGLKALKLAEINHLNSINEIRSLLSIIYFDNGKTEMGLSYAGIEGNPESMNWIELYNVGTMLEDARNHKRAEEYYLLAIAKSNEELKKKSEREKLTERAKLDPLYSSLAGLYNDLNKPALAFDVVENSKSQGLSEKLQIKGASLNEIQNLLGPDEAFISYKKLNPSVFLVIVVTQDQVISDKRYLNELVNNTKDNFGAAFKKLDEKLSAKIYQSPNFVLSEPGLSSSRALNEGDFELFIEFYRAYLTNELKDYLPQFSAEDIEMIGGIMQRELYGNFIWPVEQMVGKKSRYYLSQDGVLNFIPFDSFKDENDEYIGIDRQFHIVSSAGILKLLKERKYSSNRNSVIAFGGAIYEEAESNVPVVSSFAEVKEWQLKSYDLVEKNEPLTDLFKGMGYGKMNYLQGTLEEVQSIKSLLEDSKIITAQNMTERKVKELSASGELKNYRVIHFATHGWAISSLPSVSGLAMSIPKISTDGEDGLLIASEIANLRFEADMVMLSACQTGLGKLYGSEGVLGLNQSLMLAGANATIVTLWPVDDYATSILVKELHIKAKENGGDYAKALKEVKTNFIEGKYNTENRDLRSPIYWAPFVYNGK